MPKKPKHGKDLLNTGIPNKPSKKELIAKIMGISLVPEGEGTGFIENLVGLALPKPAKFETTIEAKFYDPDEHKELQDGTAIVASGGWCAPKSDPLYDATAMAAAMKESMEHTEKALIEWTKKASDLAVKMQKSTQIVVVVADGSNPNHPEGQIGYLYGDVPMPDGWKMAEDQSLLQGYSFSTHSGVDGADTMKIIRDAIPGFDEMRVTHPVTGAQTLLQSAIINLNDCCGWTREQVADWLETLDHDLTIRPAEETREEATR